MAFPKYWRSQWTSKDSLPVWTRESHPCSSNLDRMLNAMNGTAHSRLNWQVIFCPFFLAVL
jgi:hypothetical protein